MTQDLKSILDGIGAKVDERGYAPPAAPPDAAPGPSRVDRQIPTAFAWARASSAELRVLLGRDPVAAVAALLGARRSVIVGPAGAGKTALAIAALRDHLERGRRGVFAPSFRLAVARARSPLGHEARDVDDAIHTPLLVLDELGGELATPTSAVTEILYERHLEARQTIVTTPFPAGELARRYGDGIARRVYEGATVIRLGAPSAAASGAPGRPRGALGT